MEKRGMEQREREKAQIDTAMDYRDADLSQPLHNNSKALRVVIIAENFLPKISDSIITLAHLPLHHATSNIDVMISRISASFGWSAREEEKIEEGIAALMSLQTGSPFRATLRDGTRVESVSE
ncbi:hypothetical protein B0H13DRAFT_1866570 [Mycena leptocephala]|nr:hypothetical protein B0H13DRAFT_1866570 [Mycena leptocephala]